MLFFADIFGENILKNHNSGPGSFESLNRNTFLLASFQQKSVNLFDASRKTNFFFEPRQRIEGRLKKYIFEGTIVLKFLHITIKLVKFLQSSP
jgi:hypothetical protein